MLPKSSAKKRSSGDKKKPRARTALGQGPGQGSGVGPGRPRTPARRPSSGQPAREAGSAPALAAFDGLSARRRDIYTEAARLFVTKGFAATSMADLADAVQITKAGLYHSITSKEDLLFTLISRAMDTFDRDVLHPVMQVSDPMERLRLALRLHIANVTCPDADGAHPMVRIAEQVSGLSPERQKHIAARKRIYLDLLTRTLGELAHQGRLASGLDTRICALSLIALILGINGWRRPGGRLTDEAISAQIQDMALRSVLRPSEFTSR